MLVLFEGVDTCGKTTQIELLAKHFKNAVITREPHSKILRKILLSGAIKSKRGELLLFLADRAEHYKTVIEPNRGKLILSDRGFLSGIGYALANGDFDFEYLVELNRFALEDNFPDLIIFFKTDFKTLKSRMDLKDKKLDSIELRGLEYLLLVQKYMEDSLGKLNIPSLTIDATKNIDSIYNQIHKKIGHYQFI
jgi:dTMP kinase